MKNSNATHSDFMRRHHPAPVNPINVKTFQEMFDDMFEKEKNEVNGMTWTRKLSKPPYAERS